MHVSAIWRFRWDIAIGTFYVAKTFCDSFSGHVISRQGQVLCQLPFPTLMVVLCYSIWYVECLSFSSSLVFFHSLFRFSSVSTSMTLSFNWVQVPYNSLFQMRSLLQMPLQFIRPSIIRVLSYLCSWVAPGQALCTGFILPYRSFGPLPWYWVEWFLVIWQGVCLAVRW